MGIYTEYLDRQMTFEELTAERKKQLGRISALRGGRAVLVLAANLSQKIPANTSICYEDLLPISDQIANLEGDALDLILETPGGSGEVAEEVVRILRGRFDTMAVIVPGWAKSAGTIMAMAGDEILMGDSSALGPIDAQLMWQGKVFSAGELLDGINKIKSEVETTGVLNKAYIPILQGMSAGELQRAENARDFAIRLVRDWLAAYKFRDWNTHSSSGELVTDEDRRQRAEEIARQLGDHAHWLTHNRSIRLDDLTKMRLQVVDYSKNAELNDAIRRYYTLLQMTFDSTNMYKIFETPVSQILRFVAPPVPPPQRPAKPDIVVADVECFRCKAKTRVQANLGKPSPLQAGNTPFPANNRLTCQQCGANVDLTDFRRQVEAQTKKPIVTDGE